MGYEWKTERKNYKVPLQRCSKLREKINTKLYLMKLILIFKKLPFTLEFLENNNIFKCYIFTVSNVVIYVLDCYIVMAYTGAIFVKL
jgi:hypothetical protein